MKDLLVVGGGPAGLATALYAARAGLQVTVWEKRGGPIDKACGEGLMPGAVAALAGLGVDPEGADLLGIRYLAGDRSATAPFRHGPGRGVRRTTLHAAMGEAVLAAGVTVAVRGAHDLRQDADAVVVDGERFRYLVAADGLHSPVRRMMGLERADRGARRYGLRRHYRVESWTSYVEVHWAEPGEAYVTPVSPDLVGVAMLTRGRGSFDEHLALFPSLHARLGDADAVGEVMGAGPLHQRCRSRVAGRVLLVGDAGGYVDALTGEGVALAVAQARAAVAAVADGLPARYEQDWHAVTRRYRLLTGSLLHATRLKPVRRSLVPVAQRLPSVFGSAVNALARPA
ncbi:MAG TPA: NAD(P)/FAD-dependent oxidoreductase [Nocardioides sp.]|jgi:flavin-dependent dehydrogenase|nr:NAD(P)/FAD-dependent oxidoreductase [Nocardioides sp.]